MYYGSKLQIVDRTTEKDKRQIPIGIELLLKSSMAIDAVLTFGRSPGK
jgi:hypothetical protein